MTSLLLPPLRRISYPPDTLELKIINRRRRRHHETILMPAIHAARAVDASYRPNPHFDSAISTPSAHAISHIERRPPAEAALCRADFSAFHRKHTIPAHLKPSRPIPNVAATPINKVVFVAAIYSADGYEIYNAGYIDCHLLTSQWADRAWSRRAATNRTTSAGG